MKETKEFQTESKELLNLMVNSIYSNNEIFLRELISNASDALDKRYYNSLTQKKETLEKSKLNIKISIDKENRKLIIEDNGCGMTKDELENNLGTIAKSGSLAYKQEQEKNDEVDIIGQFGVGFYSCFMVADDVRVASKVLNSDEAYEWHSQGVDGYTVEPTQKEDEVVKNG